MKPFHLHRSRAQTTGVCSRYRQAGSALLISLILLTLTALAVAAAYSLSVSNLLVVGNVQRAEEAQAAGLRAMEASVSAQIRNIPALTLGAVSPAAWPVVDVRNEDVDGDGVNDFSVSISTFRCIEALLVTVGAQSGTSTSNQLTVTSNYDPFVAHDTLWEFEGTVTDLRGAGSRVTLVTGVRIQLTQAQQEAYCPAPS